MLFAHHRSCKIIFVMPSRAHAIMNTSSNGFPVDEANAPVTDAPVERLPDAPSRAEPPVTRVEVTCSNCKAKLRVRLAYVGNAVKCKQCGQIFTVPADAGTGPLAVGDDTFGDPRGRASQAGFDGEKEQPSALDSVYSNQLAQFIASTKDLQSSHDRLKDERDGLKVNRDEISARLVSVTSELNEIRAELGTIAPADVRVLAAEREDLHALVQSLRDEIHNLQTKLSDRDDSIDQLEKNVLELAPFRAEHAALLEKLESHEREIGDVRAERDTIARNLSELERDLGDVRTERDSLARNLGEHKRDLGDVHAERHALSTKLGEHERDLATVHAERDELETNLGKLETDLAAVHAERDGLETNLAKLETDLAAVHAERDAIATNLARHESDLAAVRAERDAIATNLARHESDLAAVHAERDGLETKLAKLESDLAAVRAERDALETNVAEHESELADVRTELVQRARRIEQADADLEAASQERERLSQELSLCRNDLSLAQANLNRSSSERQSVLETQAARESEHDALLKAERAAHQKLAEEVLALRANAEETARVTEQLISSNSNPPDATLGSSDQLEAARAQAKELKYKLEEADWLYGVMRETLNGLGIQIDLPIRPRGRVEAQV